MSGMKQKKVLLFYNPFSGNGMFKNNLDHIIERYQKEGYLVIPVRAEKGKILNALLACAWSTPIPKVLNPLLAKLDGT